MPWIVKTNSWHLMHPAALQSISASIPSRSAPYSTFRASMRNRCCGDAPSGAREGPVRRYLTGTPEERREEARHDQVER